MHTSFANWSEIFHGRSVTHYLSIVHPSYRAYIPVLVFGLVLARKYAMSKGLGPQNPTKTLAQWVDLLGQQLSRKQICKIFRPEPPPPPSFNSNVPTFLQLLLNLCICRHLLRSYLKFQMVVWITSSFSTTSLLLTLKK